MLDWLAWQVQRTGDLVGYCPLILGTQGDGKTTLGRILAAAIGDRNCKEVKNSSIKENWNAWANGSAVAFIEEIRATGRDRFDIYNEIKPLFTNAVVSIRGMNTSPIDVVNVTNYIAFTNHNDAVPIDDNDRRFHIMETAFCGHPFPQESYQEYFIDLYDAIEANAKGIYRFLNDYEISDRFCTERTPPKSEAKARMINNALSSGAQGILERIESLGDSILLDGCVSTILLKQRDNPINFENELPQTKAIAFAMAELGYIKQQVRPRFGGIRHTIYKKK